jgi:uncharacterized membrane protein YkvA (DUF1232 family)
MFFGRILGRQAVKRFSGGRISQPNKMQAMMRLPQLLRLGYALMRDERVPLWQRCATIGAVGLIFSPVDVPSLVPVAGQFWDFTLAVVVLDVFSNNAPAHVVNEHILALGLEKKIPLRRI